MNKVSSDFLNFYDLEVVKLMNEKYDIDFMEAFKMFLNSETYKMLENPKMMMYQFGAPGIFDIWENERITGSPLTSVYLRGE